MNISMRRSSPSLVVAALGALALAGCQSDSTGAVQGAEEWTVGAASFSVGGMAEDPDYQLFDARGAARLSDGRVAILNGGTSQIRFYGPDGTHLMDVGREGDGPGEFRYMASMVRLPGDTLLITSQTPGFSWISPDGEVVRSERFNIFGVRIDCRISEGNFISLGDATTMARYDDNFYGSECPVSPPNPWRQSALLAHVDPIEESWDTIAILTGTERNSPNYRVFGHEALVAVAEDGVYAHDTAAEEILKLSLDGDTLAVLPRPFAPRPVPDSARTAAVREFERNGEVVRGNPYMYPEMLPAVARLVAARDGTLWVMAYPEVAGPETTNRFSHSYFRYGPPEGGKWAVLNDQGETLAEVRTPPGFFPMEIGTDYLLGIQRDDFDVETVVIYPIERG